MKLSLLLFIFFFKLGSFGQKENSWFLFQDETTELYGYKDSAGVIQIAANLDCFLGCATKFDHVMVVTEVVGEAASTYYRTKTGRKVGKGKVYVFDYMYDCESEGFIRFTDSKTNKTGLFNRHGDVVVPAIYDGLTQVRNGVLLGLKGARKEYWDKDEHNRTCDHFSWVGGTTVLMDTAHRVLINDFQYNEDIDYYSLKITDEPHPDSIRDNFKAVNGGYYSFINFEKEFRTWLITWIGNELDDAKLLEACFSVVHGGKSRNLILLTRKAFVNTYGEQIRSLLIELSELKVDFFVSSAFAYPSQVEPYLNSTYFDNCGQAQLKKYPVMQLTISHTSNSLPVKDYMSFMRMEEGYKLIRFQLHP